ncbi:MAG: hypothetical protein E6J45_13975 [Chloroflexi bacterium]|nr:MAG: hypothetical protein E6J45_13975 [Chloroflexota bacterium]
MARLRVVDAIGVLETLFVLYGPIGSSTLQRNAVLIAGRAISVLERFAQAGVGIEVGFAAPRVPFVVWAGHGCRISHASTSYWST